MLCHIAAPRGTQHAQPTWAARPSPSGMLGSAPAASSNSTHSMPPKCEANLIGVCPVGSWVLTSMPSQDSSRRTAAAWHMRAARCRGVSPCARAFTAAPLLSSCRRVGTSPFKSGAVQRRQLLGRRQRAEGAGMHRQAAEVRLQSTDACPHDFLCGLELLVGVSERSWPAGACTRASSHRARAPAAAQAQHPC